MSLIQITFYLPGSWQTESVLKLTFPFPLHPWRRISAAPEVPRALSFRDKDVQSLNDATGHQNFRCPLPISVALSHNVGLGRRFRGSLIFEYTHSSLHDLTPSRPGGLFLPISKYSKTTQRTDHEKTLRDAL